MCEAAGLPAYEVSNHAAPGEESRHNLTYWRYGDYLGVGPGAHGRLTVGGKKYAIAAMKAPADWLAKVRERGSGAKSTLNSIRATRRRRPCSWVFACARGSTFPLFRRRRVSAQRFEVVAPLEEEGLLSAMAIG